MVVGSTVTDSWQKQWQCGVAMRLARRRRSCGLTQAQLADAIDVDRATVARWESGQRVPSALHAILTAWCARRVAALAASRRPQRAVAANLT